MGFLVAISVAITWLSVAFGLASKTVEGASNLPMPLVLLPFLGSGCVPTDGAVVRRLQPFTPIMDTVRGRQLGTAIGSNAWMAAVWCVAITVVGHVWAKKLYNVTPHSDSGRL